jgi:hypothetical protein
MSVGCILFIKGILRIELAQECRIESAVEAELVSAGRVRQSVLRSAFEGRL